MQIMGNLLLLLAFAGTEASGQVATAPRSPASPQQLHAPASVPDVGPKPCIASRCQNGWHDLSKSVWDCANTTAPTDAKFQAAIGSACAGTDLDLYYQTCTQPCCECWQAYWPAYIDLWGRCGAPASYVNGEARNGLEAKGEWLCSTGRWGACVAARWNVAAFTQCTSAPDRSKLKEVFGLYRDRRSPSESCGCLHQATVALEGMMSECQVQGRQWFVDYGRRRFRENLCGELVPAAGAEELAVAPRGPLVAVAGAVGAVAAAGAAFFLTSRRRTRGAGEGGLAPLLA